MPHTAVSAATTSAKPGSLVAPTNRSRLAKVLDHLDPDSKQACLIALLCRRRGATMADMTTATGWQPHSVRSALSRRFRKMLGLAVVSKVVRRRGRVYRLARDVR